MKRHYDGLYMKALLEKVRKIKRKDGVEISLGADIIVGFPGETEENFQETFDLIKTQRITKVHAFPFSPHKYGESVPAGFYKDQIPEKVKDERMKKILTLAKEVRNSFIDNQIGKSFQALIEVAKDGKWKGWTENYIEVTDENFEVKTGEIKKNEIVSGILLKRIEEKDGNEFGM